MGMHEKGIATEVTPPSTKKGNVTLTKEILPVQV
jgi:hypothetical protein